MSIKKRLSDIKRRITVAERKLLDEQAGKDQENAFINALCSLSSLIRECEVSRDQIMMENWDAFLVECEQIMKAAVNFALDAGIDRFDFVPSFAHSLDEDSPLIIDSFGAGELGMGSFDGTSARHRD